ncbi:hypothetical protein [Rhodoferax koreensis]|nr:hypothetical protein [Rhodoferax koreense]
MRPHFPFRLVALLALTVPAWAQTPAKGSAKALRGDLTVELRQIDEQAGYVVGTRPRTPPLAPQQVQVRNGEKAVLRMGQSLPVKWTQSVSQGGYNEGAGVSYGLVWMEAGQGFTVTPRWPGGKQPVSLQIDVTSASVDASTGAELPNQQRSQFSTTVSAPLGQWVTLASTGGEQAQKGVYSSRAAANVRQLIQVRVSAP